uniref:Uncharacterized protein n=1 Tax=Meloidogyne enterolobii TaxID=390850 RepID=A0A6V7X9F3_MELEN|nr:unnamed protein product [Meloidogyne enterolobii]
MHISLKIFLINFFVNNLRKYYLFLKLIICLSSVLFPTMLTTIFLPSGHKYNLRGKEKKENIKNLRFCNFGVK